MGCVSNNAKSCGSCVSVGAKRIDGIKIRCSLVCEVNRDTYLRVTPSEAQWITVDEVITYKVYSNTSWEIV